MRPRRRRLLGLLGGLGLSPSLAAHPPRKLVLYFNEGGNPRVSIALEKLRQALRTAEGTRSFDVELRHVVADPHKDQLEPIMRRALDSRPDAILAPSGVLALAARAVTSDIPIVFGSHQDPVALGLVSSLENPGANATGFTFYAPIDGKRLELLLMCHPGARVLGIVADRWWDADPGTRGFENTARAFGLEARFVRANTVADLQRVLGNGAAHGVDAWFVGNTPAFDHPAEVARAINGTRKPAIYMMGLVVAAGGLMSYQALLDDPFAIWAKLLGLVLNGVAPARIPVEPPRKFELHVNETTAARLGIALPRSLLLRATHLHRDG